MRQDKASQTWGKKTKDQQIMQETKKTLAAVAKSLSRFFLRAHDRKMIARPKAGNPVWHLSMDDRATGEQGQVLE